MFIIDGYNLLKWIEKSGKGVERVSDVQLCHVVGRYLKQVGAKGDLVFDGIGPPDKGRFENIPNLQVSFSGYGSDADEVIEGKIEVSTAPRDLTVVSSDRRLRVAARRRRASAVKSGEFWADVCKQLSESRRKVREPSGKRQGLTESETEQWLKYFGLE
jgi:predicted RNA-binding protein with PIN domain